MRHVHLIPTDDSSLRCAWDNGRNLTVFTHLEVVAVVDGVAVVRHAERTDGRFRPLRMPADMARTADHALQAGSRVLLEARWEVLCPHPSGIGWDAVTDQPHGVMVFVASDRDVLAERQLLGDHAA